MIISKLEINIAKFEIKNLMRFFIFIVRLKMIVLINNKRCTM